MPLTQQTPVALNYRLDGNPDKPALLFLNSLGTNLHMWDVQVKALENDFYMIRMDTRGHGQSSVPQGPYTLNQLGLDAVELLDELKISEAAVCGISMGGITALWLALKFPHRFKKIIAANTAAKIGHEPAWNERATQVMEQSHRAMIDLASSAPQRWFTAEFTQHNPEWVDGICNMLSNTPPAGYAACCQALAVADLRDTLSRISVPVCVIAGQFDPVTTVEDAQYICSAVPHSCLKTLKASHLSNIEQADAFSQTLRDYLHK
ncbi:MAG: 3-oxoadipate enol-lactonase [Limnobacter sp.]|nr:3-oxoadipate enol-lactonase [Limnobacter sp.]